MTNVRRSMNQPALAGFNIPLDSITVATWCPDAHAQKPPEQVHLVIELVEVPPMVMRFKSPDTLGIIIAELISCRREVWPDAPEIGEAR